MARLIRGELETRLNGELVLLDWEAFSTEPENFSLLGGASIEQDREFTGVELERIGRVHKEQLEERIAWEMDKMKEEPSYG